MLLREAHSRSTHLLVVGLEFAIHHLDRPHFGQPPVTSFLFNCKIHQVLPLVRNKPGGDGDVSNGHITASKPREV